MNSLLQSLRNLGPARLIALVGVGLATIAVLGLIVARLSTPPMRLLYSDLDLRDSGQVVQKLDAMNVPYELKAGGSEVLVAADQVARTRMMMAEQGLPHGGSVGYEIFDKSEPLGTTTFQENMDKLRALEGELARTIASLSIVDSARVHLVLPQRELFSREREQPSASIVLKLRGAAPLGKNQVAAIQHLVAAAVPDLKPERVVIVDSNGNLLVHSGGNGDLTAGDYDDQRTAYESSLDRTLENMLARTLGPGKVRVEAHADMDFDRETINTESYDPDGQVVRSTQSVTDSHTSGGSASNPPVSVSTNLPDAQAKKSTASGTSENKNDHHEETTNYEISKTVKNLVREGGDVKRLSVAVLVDGTYTKGKDGAQTYQPRSPDELKQIDALVRSAIGYDKKRGDTVDVVNLRFASTPHRAAEAPDTIILGMTKGDLFRAGESAGLVVVALLVILLVVRPVINRIFDALPGAAAAGEPQRLLTHRDGTAALPAPDGTMVQRDLAEIEQMIDIGQVEGRVRASSVRKIGEIVEKHPEEAVAIVRSWMDQRD